MPYVYFRAEWKTGYSGNLGWGGAKPYCYSSDNKWVDADMYQILCAGQDGKFGAGHHFPGGDDYDNANMDDITSFSGSATLGQLKTTH
jgi:hypothetical protein